MIEKKKVWTTDVAMPGDSRIEDEELEKVTKYKVWNMKA